MAPASDRNPQIMLPAETNGGNHVGHISALRDQTRFATDHGVIDFAGFLITRVGGLDQLTAELTLELSDRFLLHGSLHIREISQMPLSDLLWPGLVDYVEGSLR